MAQEELAILFIPFDATKGHNRRMATRGVDAMEKGVSTLSVKGKGAKGKVKGSTKSKGAGTAAKGKATGPVGTTCFAGVKRSCATTPELDVIVDKKRPKQAVQYEGPGKVMDNIMKHVNGICDEMLIEIDGDKKKCPDVIFLSELLKDDDKVEREFPKTIKCSKMQVAYSKMLKEAGVKAAQRIAAYVRDGCDMKFEANDITWQDPNFAQTENVLLVTEQKTKTTVAGLHLTAKNVGQGNTILGNVMRNLQMQCKDKNISLMIGDFNFDVMHMAFVMDQGMEGWPGHVIGDDKKTVPSNSVNDAFFMGITYDTKIIGNKKFTECIVLPRSIEMEYFSDHPAVYTCLSI